MSIPIAALLAASHLAARTPLPYDAGRDVAITGVAAALWGASAVFDKQFAPSACRWCNPPPFDVAARDALKWDRIGWANRMSDVLAYGGMPVAAFAANYLASGRDAKATAADALIALEAAMIAGLFNQGVKFLVGRERPFVHHLAPRDKPNTARVGDNNLSFYSGHTSFTMAVAVATAVCASMRGEADVRAVWATGVPLALFTGYLRIAADNHYASDVIVGGITGSLFGFAVPKLLHRPSSPAPSTTARPRSPRSTLQLPALTFSAAF